MGLRIGLIGFMVGSVLTAGNYQPPAESVSRLGSIADHLRTATKLERPVARGGERVFVLPGGQIFYEAALALDTDGSRYYKQDPTGQKITSITNPDDSPVDADTVPYFVMPCKGFQRKLGVRLGDIAAVIWQDKVEFAVFADCGPDALGEGSIALHRSLGHETVAEGKLINEDFPEPVITIVFPQSGIEGQPQTPEKIRETGRELFRALGGLVP